MPTKTKTSVTAKESLARAAQQAGIVLMTAAVTIGMLEVPEDSRRVIVPNQPSIAFAEDNDSANPNNNPLRREREETAPHYISYGINQRTPSRSGKH